MTEPALLISIGLSINEEDTIKICKEHGCEVK